MNLPHAGKMLRRGARSLSAIGTWSGHCEVNCPGVVVGAGRRYFAWFDTRR